MGCTAPNCTGTIVKVKLTYEKWNGHIWISVPVDVKDIWFKCQTCEAEYNPEEVKKMTWGEM